MNGINGTVNANGISGVLGYTKEELTLGLNTERMATIVGLLGGDSSKLPNNLYSAYLDEIIRLLQEAGGVVDKAAVENILKDYINRHPEAVASTWDGVQNKPFDRLGESLKVVDGTLDVNAFEVANASGGNTLIIG